MEDEKFLVYDYYDGEVEGVYATRKDAEKAATEWAGAAEPTDEAHIVIYEIVAMVERDVKYSIKSI